MSSFRKLLDYMINDKDRLFDENDKSFAVTHNLSGNSIEEWEQQYRENEQYRLNKRSDSILATHEIISFNKKDAENITLEKLEDMAREYIQQRNPNGIYVAVPHFDKEHYHVHVCASGIEFRTGKGMRLGKKELQEFKQKVQQYQIKKYPELNKSIVGHGAPPKEHALSDREFRYKQRTGRATDKERIAVMLKTFYKSAASKIDFFNQLNENGLETYIRGNKTTGIVYEGKKFRFKGLGFTEKSIEDLDIPMKRQEDLNKMREKSGKSISREI